ARTLATAPGGSNVRVIQDTTPELFVKLGPTEWRDQDDAANAFPSTLPTGLTEAKQPRTALLTLTLTATDADGNTATYEDLGFDPAHPRWLGNALSKTPSRRRDHLERLFAIENLDPVSPFALAGAIVDAETGSRVYALSGGNDGGEPGQDDYEAALEPVARNDEVSIVAAPGHSTLDQFQGIQGALISHVEAQRAYRIAVLDTPPDQALSEAQEVRSRIDSTRAALYYPWVAVANPLVRPGDESQPRELTLPPSGFVCGIYARNDVERGVSKAPANEVVRGALRFETDISMAEQAVLNPRGINCLRFFEGRGYRVWGARTVSSDPEWKYVNVRRYFNYLERSIDRGTQWVVFENNGERLWTNVRQTVSDFLYNEWVSGALLGSRPEEAFFVRCDRSTMTQNDLDFGRLICLIGVAVLKPAEFVIFRIGQKTADTRN
ncbi:MAG: phage tail sheath family protein, partial [Gemmatimonadales bacterium]